MDGALPFGARIRASPVNTPSCRVPQRRLWKLGLSIQTRCAKSGLEYMIESGAIAAACLIFLTFDGKVSHRIHCRDGEGLPRSSIWPTREQSSTGIRDLPTKEQYRRGHNTAGRNTRDGDGPLELLFRHRPDGFVRPLDDPLPWLLANTRRLG